jgi:hypothetical protein
VRLPIWLDRLQNWLGIEPEDAWRAGPLQPSLVRSAAYDADLAELRAIVASLREGIDI